MATMRCLALATASLLIFITSCTTAEPTAGPSPTTEGRAEAEAADPITVTVSLRRAGHSEPVAGTVTDAAGAIVATFTLAPDFFFLEDVTAENAYRPATSTVVGGTVADVQLPGPGPYTFAIDQVFFWGGCGTCGEVFSGGEITRDVEAGSRLTVPLGERTGST